MTSRAAITTALQTLITGAVNGITVLGFEGEPVKPFDLTSPGAAVLIRVEAGDPEMDLGIRTYHHEPTYLVDLLAESVAEAEALAVAIGGAIAADPTVGGTSEWTTVTSVERDDESEEGSVGYVALRLAIAPQYSSTNPAE